MNSKKYILNFGMLILLGIFFSRCKNINLTPSDYVNNNMKCPVTILAIDSSGYVVLTDKVSIYTLGKTYYLAKSLQSSEVGDTIKFCK